MLKRIKRYLGAQDWNAIAIEFVIVTAGVLMGIQVSNWNDDRLEKARVDQQLASLRTELKGNLATIKRYQRHGESQLGDITALERAFDRPNSGDAPIDGKLMTVFRVSSLILETSAYDELTETGSFRHVDPKVRSAMTEWQARKGLVQRADQDALSYRLSAADYLGGALAFEPMVRTFAPSFQPAGDAPVRNDPARLAKDAKVRNFLAMRYGIETQKLQFATDLGQATESLLTLLEQRQ
ncbi:MAG: hypothetical protein V4502_00710 [Pseudomonadota bacterium]